MKKYTKDEIDAMMTPKGGFTRKTLESIGVSWPPRKGWRDAITIREPRPSRSKEAHAHRDGDIIVYSDGACRPNPGPGAFAAIIITGGTQRQIGGFERTTTNNRMELMAAICALESIPSGSVHLHTDSRYVLDGITTWIHGWIRKGWRTQEKKDVLNKDLWIRLHAQNTRLEVRWTWVRGHSGNPMNELVDSVAAKLLNEGLAVLDDIPEFMDHLNVSRHWKTL